MADPRVAIVGATGAVGRVALRVLEERNFPLGALRLTASHRSIGKKLPFRGQDIVVEETTAELFAQSDIAFISANEDVSREMCPLAVENGCVAIDDSGVWRMDPSVPLVVPEVNGDDIDAHKGILSIPNCSTTPLVMALWPLHQVNPVRRIVVATYQSVSGTGAAAMAELDQQSKDVLAGNQTKAEQYPHQIAFNALPHIGGFDDDGFTSEEVKMLRETQKIMHAPELPVTATCVRIPVQISHSEALNVEFERPITPEEARALMRAFPGVTVTDDPASASYPMPIDAAGKDDVFVGRVRQDVSDPNALALWVVSDNLRKGAATNAVQIAEEIVKRGAWLRQRV
ncbi:MAG: aspartate-semialdehyde dehydrogenase [Dehalococcoidia bacterium]